MRITKKESRVLLAGIIHCKEQGMNDDWMEEYLIEQIERLSKFSQYDVSGSVCGHELVKMEDVYDAYGKCQKCGELVYVKGLLI